MFYTYILESVNNPNKRYIGHSADLRQRLKDHNAGLCPSSAEYRPWGIKIYVAFENMEKAIEFEAYLKSGSGHAFANRHFHN
jgi:putative endonuclease